MREAVVLVHGLWRNGWDLWRLHQYLTASSYDCYRFGYPSLCLPPAVNAERLNDFAATIDAPVVHYVCHSLGGIVLLHLFDKHPLQKPGRIVLMGTPVNGSIVARRLAATRFTRWTLGKSIEEGVLTGGPAWFRWRDLGIIAGTLPLGAGMLVGGLRPPHDGVVTVSEAHLMKATDYITLPVSHTGLLFSRTVAALVVTFLRAGKFGDVSADLLMDIEPT